MATTRNFEFSGIVESVHFNQITTAVFLPHHIIIELPRGRVKATGIMNGVPFSVSVLYRKDTGRYFPINLALRKAANIEPGDAVNVNFKVIDPEKVDLPAELETVLNEDDKARKIWKTLTISMQRVLADYIESAKRIDMRVRRAVETVQRARKGFLQPQSSRKKKNP
jgi:hypothetical protein